MGLFCSSLSSVFLLISGFDVEIEFLASDFLVHLQYLITCLFEVGSSVIALSHEQIVTSTIISGFVDSADLHEHL